MPNMRFTRGGRMLYREISKRQNAKDKEKQKMNEPLNETPNKSLNKENQKRLNLFKIIAVIPTSLLFSLGVAGLILTFKTLNSLFLFISFLGIPAPIIYFYITDSKKEALLAEQEKATQKEKENIFDKIVNPNDNSAIDNKNKVSYDIILKPDETMLKQFQKPICNYIEMMYSKDKYFFDPSFFHYDYNKHFTYPKNCALLVRLVNRDGVKNEQVKKETTVLADFINTEILKNGYYESDLSPVATYGIIRYFIIKFFHDKYVAEIGYPTYQEYCENTDYYSRNDALFFYFKQFEDNIYAPLEKSYDEFAEKIKYYQAEFERQSILNSLLKTDNEPTKEYEDIDLFFENLNENDKPQSPIDLIDQMDGRQFELYIADLFKKKGYKAVATQSSGDFGIDVILEKDFFKIGIQTKCYSNKVSNSAVQEAVAAKKHYNLDKVMVITNNYFTPSAIQLAKDNNVALWNRDKLIEEIDNLK